jgi:hypothetical protein
MRGFAPQRPFLWGAAPNPAGAFAPDPTKGAEPLWNPTIFGRFSFAKQFVSDTGLCISRISGTIPNAD